MHKISLFLTFFSLSLFSAELQLPPIVDYGKFQASLSNYGTFEKESWDNGYYAFNFAPELIPFFTKLKRAHSIDVAIETGTFLGGTALVLSLIFDEVHTLEIVEDTFIKANLNLKDYSNVHNHLGSSEVVLKQLLPPLRNQRVLFYLDAHWESHWPLLQELEEIGQTHKDNCIIVIDDIKVPDRADIPYNRFGNDDCSFEYVKNQLDKVFTDYTYHYLIPRSVNSRAKLVVIPKAWNAKP